MDSALFLRGKMVESRRKAPLTGSLGSFWSKTWRGNKKQLPLFCPETIKVWEWREGWGANFKIRPHGKIRSLLTKSLHLLGKLTWSDCWLSLEKRREIYSLGQGTVEPKGESPMKTRFYSRVRNALKTSRTEPSRRKVVQQRQAASWVLPGEGLSPGVAMSRSRVAGRGRVREPRVGTSDSSCALGAPPGAARSGEGQGAPGAQARAPARRGRGNKAHHARRGREPPAPPLGVHPTLRPGSTARNLEAAGSISPVPGSSSVLQWRGPGRLGASGFRWAGAGNGLVARGPRRGGRGAAARGLRGDSLCRRSVGSSDQHQACRFCSREGPQSPRRA